MVEDMYAIAIAKSTKPRKFKVERNKLFHVTTLLRMNPRFVVLFLAKCDPILGTLLYKTLGFALFSCARQADAPLANKVLAPEQGTDSLE